MNKDGSQKGLKSNERWIEKMGDENDTKKC